MQYISVTITNHHR